MAKNKQKQAVSNRKSTSLPDLPSEIIRNILIFLPKRNPSLASLCLVSKSIHCHAESLLYSTIVLEWTRKRLPPIVSLLETLIQRPELSGSIVSLSLQGYDPVGDETEWEPNLPTYHDLPSLRPSQSAVQRLIPIIQDFKLSFTDFWVARIHSGEMDAFAALLIALLSNASRVIIADNFLRSPRFIARVLQSKAKGLCQMPKFKRLQKIVFYAPGPMQIAETAVAPFHLQTITQLAVSLRGVNVVDWPAGGFAHLTSLDLNSHCPALMAGLLSQTPNLRSLSWAWESYHGYHAVDFGDMIVALLPVKNTLESLQLRLEPFQWELDAPPLRVSGSVDALVDFDRITDLGIPLMCLAGFGHEPQPMGRRIPRNVERLLLSTSIVPETILLRAQLLFLDEDVLWETEEQCIRDLVAETINDLMASHFATPPRPRYIGVTGSFLTAMEFRNGIGHWDGS